MIKKPNPLFAALLLCFCTLSSASSETSNADANALAEQRSAFLAAEAALEADYTNLFQRLKARLRDYPLYPYLVYQETLHSLAQHTPGMIRERLAMLQDTPLQAQLLNHWLSLLAEEGLWYTYMAFSAPGGSIERECQRLHALMQTGKRQQAFQAADKIWLSADSRPKACDPVLDSWIAAGKLTRDLLWQRFDLAMHAGQTRLARYLQRYMTSEDSAWADRWLALYSNPYSWTQLIGLTHPKLSTIATQTVQRLAYRDVDEAFTAWRKLNNGMLLSDLQHLKIARSLMGQLTRQETKLNNRQITALLPRKYLTLDSNLSDKQIQFTLQNGDWDGLLETLDSIPLQEQESERWQYWRARALINLGRNGEGEAIFKQLAGERSYYGFLAAMRLGNRPSLLHETLATDLDQVNEVSKLSGLKRARELHRLGRSLEARREWNLALKEKSDIQLRAAVRLAEQWDWPSQAIITLTRLRFWNDLELRFPLAHQQVVTSLANAQGIDRAWVYAILRQESAFMTDARSKVGARGLMQLMPKTAKEVAEELSESIQLPDDLYQPEVNIKLGTSYLNKIYRQLQENPVLATAAYNAGPLRVQTWLPEKTQAADVWIETVPFHETREYLKRVLAYTVIYNYRLGLDPTQSSSSWLQPIVGITTGTGS